MATLAALRELVATGCRVLAAEGVSDGILGHVSARVDERSMLIRCRGAAEAGLAHTTAADVRHVGLDGSPHEAPEGFRVPHELAIHGELYRARADVAAVVHAHPTAALIAGLADLPLRPIFGAYNIPAARMALDGVPTYPRSVLISRPELGRAMVAAMDGKAVCVLRGHGITTTGASVPEAVVRAVDLRALAQVTVDLAALGATPAPLPDEDVAELPDLGAGLNVDAAWRAYARRLPAS